MVGFLLENVEPLDMPIFNHCYTYTVPLNAIGKC